MGAAHSSKSQSAMEYLMTYGWAILIIAIVLIAIFQLGILGGTNVAPHATAGACQIYRSTAGSSLAGQCNNLEPQFVSHFTETPYYPYILVPDSGALDPTSQITVTAWVYPNSQLANNPGGSVDHDILSKGVDVATGGSSGSYSLLGGAGTTIDASFFVYINGALKSASSGVLQANRWYFYTGTYNGVSVCIFVNGVSAQCNGDTGAITTVANPLGIGSDSPPVRFYNGSISNVQIYNTSLSQSEITALYQEGIGGAPIDPTHIVGWWPLNGNVQDYSGNNNNGVPSNIVYTSSWTSSYTQP